MTKTIFLSWQSDLDAAVTKNPLRKAIRKACRATGTSLKLDEATRGMTGANNILTALHEKIESCDIFVADVSTVLAKTDITNRAFQNPNVLYELGYAASWLGWDRILLMVYSNNTKDFSKDLPFDLPKHRATPFYLSEKSDSSGQEKLNASIENAITEILRKNPVKSHEKPKFVKAEVRRQKDLRQLKMLLEQIDLAEIDKQLDLIPDYLRQPYVIFGETAHNIVSHSLWRLHDKKLNELVISVTAAWFRSLNYGSHYNSLSNGQVPLAKFHWGHGTAERMKSEHVRAEIVEHVHTLVKQIRLLLDYLEAAYPEIDPSATSLVARRDFLEGSMPNS